MKECSKAVSRRLSDPAFATRYLRGEGVDVGGYPDPLELYLEFYPLVTSIRTWDWEDGDAQFMSGVPDDSFDFVHSSHCLEHLEDPFVGLSNWVRVCRPNGFLVVTVPDEDLYEQGVFPSTFNRDHKWTFTINKKASWSHRSVRLFDLIDSQSDLVEVERLDLVNRGYRYNLPRFDQTLTPMSESGIEFVLRKRSIDEIERGGLAQNEHNSQPSLDKYFNQYLADWQAAKQASPVPFIDESPI